MTNQNRHLAGVPVGGQFAIATRTESAVTLTPPVPDVVAAAVPRGRSPEHATYYAQNDAKHFTAAAAGSTFTDPTLACTEDVVTLALTQRGTLTGDDREQLIAAGSDPAGFSPRMRYLQVTTPGTVGVVHTTGLGDLTPVRVVRDKVGAPCAPVVLVDEQPTTDFACVIIATDRDTGGDLVLTTFPGPVTRPTASDDLDRCESQTLTLGVVRTILGRDFHANTSRA